MNLPDVVKSKSFWESVSLIVSGVLALLVYLGKVDSSWAVPSAVIFAWISGLLKMFNVELEFKYRQLQAKVASLQNQLTSFGLAINSKPTVNKKK